MTLWHATTAMTPGAISATSPPTSPNRKRSAMKITGKRWSPAGFPGLWLVDTKLEYDRKNVVVLCQSIESHEIPEILFPCLIQEGLRDRLWTKGVQWVCRDLQHSIGERLQHSRTRGESRTKCQFPLSLYFQNPCLWLVRFLLSDWPIFKANRSTLLRIKSHI